MNAVFVDAGYFVAFISTRDQWHAQAMYFATTNTARMITSEYVLLEVANYFRNFAQRSEFLALLESLEVDDATEIIPATEIWWRQGLDLFRRRPDKDWSLTDCISFCMMEDRGLTHAVKADKHFEQAGFIKLLG